MYQRTAIRVIIWKPLFYSQLRFGKSVWPKTMDLSNCEYCRFQVVSPNKLEKHLLNWHRQLESRIPFSFLKNEQTNKVFKYSIVSKDNEMLPIGRVTVADDCQKKMTVFVRDVNQIISTGMMGKKIIQISVKIETNMTVTMTTQDRCTVKCWYAIDCWDSENFVMTNFRTWVCPFFVKTWYVL